MSDYLPGDRVNAGGQGEVFTATAPDGTVVAVKYLALDADEEKRLSDRARFEREARIQSTLQHPGILPVIAIRMDADPPYFAMPLADESLRSLLSRNANGLTREDVVRIMGRVLEAVAYAHAEGVVHRDLKPENILVIGGDPLVADFGLGRRLYSDSTLTVTHGGLGSHGYAAPEQYTDAHQADERADVFALGCILYELLTSRRFVSGPRWDEVPPEFQYLLMSATKQERDQRLPSVDEFIVQYRWAVQGEKTLMAPSDQAVDLANAIARGEKKAVSGLSQILVSNGDDVQLFLQILPFFSAEVVRALANHDLEQFRLIVERFDQYADARHPWSFTDRIAVFMSSVFHATGNVAIRAQVLKRLYCLGSTHNRFFVRDRFVELVGESIRVPALVPMVAAIIREEPWALPFCREELLGLSLPGIVRAEVQ